MNEVTLVELEAQRAELLPVRETLFFNFNWADVYASNSSVALNVATALSEANSAAVQTILVGQ
ncbi:hypothetical protein LVY72_00865 [Arthrobacter sp. I2-34]|uniref:Uncharacterized protein n=1 Tax=Arthrobacter hankyongi TaxID=2904801 RepID=A0ABS9L1Q6_9MICC|nr:hypothetical protein [Arthrobacter hankyongi]MCG2620459.1 hypothetical protein [Arthrobacter hankyongi]